MKQSNLDRSNYSVLRDRSAGMITAKSKAPFMIIAYIVLIILAVMSVFPFIVMLINATRSTQQISTHAISLIPSSYLMSNINILINKSFDPFRGFANSLIISVGATACATYFSSLTAYSLTAYDWRMRQPFFTFIVAIMMVPAQLSTIGFYQFMYTIGLNDSFLPLILPAVASPAIVFFMRQYLLATFTFDISNAARIDGAGEFRIFNFIVLPIMKPAIATQAIFVFVSSWNNYFMPMILLNDQKRYTMPIMVSLLRGDIYKTEYGSIYAALSLSILPLFVIYFALSRYIIAGVSLGGVKE